MNETSTRDERQVRAVIGVIAVTIGAFVGASVVSNEVILLVGDDTALLLALIPLLLLFNAPVEDFVSRNIV